MEHTHWNLEGITHELLQAERALRGIGPAISMFGSSRLGENDPLNQRAFELARDISAAGYAIMTGGGPGLMDAFNRGAQAGGSTSVGLGIHLATEQTPNPHIDIHLHFERFFTRKAVFVRYSRAFVVMPGGWGTLDELFEILCLINTGKVQPVPVILVGDSYWDELLHWLNTHLVSKGTIDIHDLGKLHVARTSADVLSLLPPPID